MLLCEVKLSVWISVHRNKMCKIHFISHQLYTAADIYHALSSSLSPQLSYEELKHVIKGYGLQFLSESWHDCTYTRCEASMMWTTYR